MMKVAEIKKEGVGGKREIAGEVEDNTELVDDDDPLCLDDGGDLKGLPNDIIPGIKSGC